jgi:hypothetical protein
MADRLTMDTEQAQSALYLQMQTQLKQNFAFCVIEQRLGNAMKTILFAARLTISLVAVIIALFPTVACATGLPAKPNVIFIRCG